MGVPVLGQTKVIIVAMRALATPMGIATRPHF